MRKQERKYIKNVRKEYNIRKEIKEMERKREQSTIIPKLLRC
jgi:hypothetical protein